MFQPTLCGSRNPNRSSRWPMLIALSNTTYSSPRTRARPGAAGHEGGDERRGGGDGRWRRRRFAAAGAAGPARRLARRAVRCPRITPEASNLVELRRSRNTPAKGVSLINLSVLLRIDREWQGSLPSCFTRRPWLATGAAASPTAASASRAACRSRSKQALDMLYVYARVSVIGGRPMRSRGFGPWLHRRSALLAVNGIDLTLHAHCAACMPAVQLRG